jgi:hypothetical protein
MKRCGRCGESLPRSSFAYRRAATDGLQNWCRACNSAWAAERRPRKRKAPPAIGSGEKWCRRCDTVKKEPDFAANARRPDGLQTYCRTCQAEDYRAKQAAAGKLVRPLGIPPGHKFCRTCQTVRATNDFGIRRAAPDGLMSMCRSCRSAANRRDHFSRSYGMTEGDVLALLYQQRGLCAICRVAPAVHVDHDHATGKVRGMLCFRCNAALGQFDDCPETLVRAARYLLTAAKARLPLELLWTEHLATAEYYSAA